MHTDLTPTPSALGSYRDFALPPFAPRRLSYTIGRGFFKGRLIPSAQTTWQGLHFILTITTLWVLWCLMQDMQWLQQTLHVAPPPADSRFSGFSTLLNKTLGFSLPLPARMHATRAVATSSFATATPSVTRRPPKETYVPPEDLWGEWGSATVDPFSATSEAKEAQREGTPYTEDVGGPGLGAAEPTFTSNWSNVIGTFTGLLAGETKHRQRILYIVNGLLRRVWDAFLAIMNVPE